MNILIINYEYPPLGGGGGVATKALAIELFKKGHRVRVLTSRSKDEPCFETDYGVEIYRVRVLGRNNKAKASLLSMLSWPAVSIIKGFSLIFKQRPDLINTHFFAPTGPTGLILSLLFNIPNIIYAHGADVFDPERLNQTPSGRGLLSTLLRISLKIQSRFAKKIIVQSTDTKSRLLKIIPKLEKKIEVIPLPFLVPDIIIQKEVRSNNKFKLVGVGRIVERKGYEYLIKAMKLLPDEIILNIIGSGGPLVDILNVKIVELGLSERCKLNIGVSEEEKYNILSSSDCFVLSSLHEGMGVVVQEAMYCGLPVVATNFGGQIDLIKDGVNGLLVEPRNPEQLAQAIFKLYNHRDLCGRFGEENRKRIENYYSQNLIDKYEKAFQI